MESHESGHSVSGWWEQLKSGQTEAADGLWRRYFERMVRTAKRSLPAGARRATDEEDVALSAFNSLCRGAKEGRFEAVQDRDDLWRLLVAITHQKVVDEIRRGTSQKRGGGEVRGESAFIDITNLNKDGINNAQGLKPTPEFMAAVDDQHQNLMEQLRDDSLRELCQMRMEGYSNDEIAERLGITTRSVERKLQLIREKWSRELDL